MYFEMGIEVGNVTITYRDGRHNIQMLHARLIEEHTAKLQNNLVRKYQGDLFMCVKCAPLEKQNENLSYTQKS